MVKLLCRLLGFSFNIITRMENLIHNVIVNNSIFEQKVHYIYSPENILNCVTRALIFVPNDIRKEINEKQLTVLVITDPNYNEIKSKTILCSDSDLIYRFNGYK